MNLFDSNTPSISFVGGVNEMRQKMAPKVGPYILPSFPNLDAAKVISLDIESRDPELRKFGPGFVRGTAEMVGLAVVTDDGFKAYYPVAHREGQNLPRNLVAKWVNDQLRRRAGRILTGANLLYDSEGMHFSGISIPDCCTIYDVQNAEAILDEESENGYSLEALGKKYLGRGKDEALLRQAAAAYGVDPKSELYKLPAKYVAPYAIEDASVAIEVLKAQLPLLEKDDTMDVFKKESRLMPLLLKMRLRGVRVDVPKTEQLNDKMKLDLIEKRKALDCKVGFQVDVGRTASLKKMFEKLGVMLPKTAKDNDSVTGPWLKEMAKHLTEAKMVLDIRLMEKMRRDFIEGYIIERHHHGRLHPKFNQLKKDEGGTVTARFSSSDPNCQNIPARDPVYGPLVRSLFIPEDGCMWTCGDYSSQETRLLVHYAELMGCTGAKLAGDKYRSDPKTDYHQWVADMAGVTRGAAKSMNLGLAYGMGQKKLALDLGFITEEQFRDPKFKKLPKAATDLFAAYHAGVPFVNEITEMCTNVANTRGDIKTIWGHKRHFNKWEPAGKNDDGSYRKGIPLAREQALEAYGPQLRRGMTHKALNALIQGSAAGMIKQAMLDMDAAGYVPHLTVHDELDMSTESEKQARDMEEIMVGAIELLVPVLVGLKTKANWGECK